MEYYMPQEDLASDAQPMKKAVDNSDVICATPGKGLTKDMVDDNEQQPPTNSPYTAKVCETLREYNRKAAAQALALKSKTTTLVKDPQFKTLTLTTATGTVVVGTVGGAFGLASGMVTGSIVGVPAALFTFGLSIPAGAVVGGGAGSLLGASTGAGVGALASYEAFKYQVEIKNGFVYAKVKVMDTTKLGKMKAMETVGSVKLQIADAMEKTQAKADELTTYAKAQTTNCKLQIADAMEKTQAKADELTTYAKAQTSNAIGVAKAKAGKAIEVATTTRTGVTCTSAAAGAVVGSTSGGSLGAISGAAMGVVPAAFTLGLSIPIGAVCGLCIGAGVGGATGATGGAAAGYGGFTYRKEISSSAQKTWDMASSSAETVKAKAAKSATQVTQSLRSLVGGSTGGTA